MPPTAISKWLSQLVMHNYTIKNPPQQNSAWHDQLWDAANHALGLTNVKVHAVVDELKQITTAPAEVYGVFDGSVLLKDPFATHTVLQKMINLDLKKADTVKFLQDLISSFDEAYSERSFHVNLVQIRSSTHMFSLYAQDAANSIIYLYVIPNLLLLLATADTASEQALINSKLNNVREIINWESSCFFFHWIKFEKSASVKAMAQALFDDSSQLAQQMKEITKKVLTYGTVYPEFEKFWEDSQMKMPHAFGQIFNKQTNVPPVPPLPIHRPSSLPIPLPNSVHWPLSPDIPVPDDQTFPSRRNHLTNKVHCDIIGNPYLIEIE